MSSGQLDHSWPPDTSPWGSLIGHEGVGVQLTKQQPDPQGDDMSCGPAVVPLLTTRCLYWGWGHWGLAGGVEGVRASGVSRGCRGIKGTLGVTYEKWWQPIANCKVLLKTQGTPELRSPGPMLVPSLATRCLWGYIWVQLNWAYVSTILGHQMPELGMSDLRLGLTFCAIGSQPASQLPSCNWPANQPCDKISTLSGFGLVRYVVAGGLGAWPHWAPVQGPSTPSGSPWGVTYLTKARQVTEMSSSACAIHLALHYWPFADLCLCHLITYSYTQCKEMLYRLHSLQTDLCISLHHQSDILLHQGTTNFIIRNQKCSGKKVYKRYIWAQVSLTKRITTWHVYLM